MSRISVNFLVITGLILTLTAFSFIKTGNIQGKITPATAASEVLAVLGTDTLKTVVNNGNFAFRNVKTGTYTLMIKANPPYNGVTVKNVAVIDSVTTDVGLIKLQ